jgi:hypothetical protein
LKITYEVRQIAEEKKIEHKQLRKVTMFEIYIKYNQIPKYFPSTIYKEKSNTFYSHKKKLEELQSLHDQSQLTLGNSNNNSNDNLSNDQTTSNYSIINNSINEEILEDGFE